MTPPLTTAQWWQFAQMSKRIVPRGHDEADVIARAVDTIEQLVTRSVGGAK